MGLRYEHFESIEKHAGKLAALIAVMIALGGLAEVVPLFVSAHAVKPSANVRPYDALRLAGRDIYVREACYQCHSQMIRTLGFEVQRYGPYSTAAESVYDRPFQWGSKRTGPDLARIGGKYSDEWQRQHLLRPRDLVPESNMPNYPWLAARTIDGRDIEARMRVLKLLGDPYSDDDIRNARDAVKGKSELDALVAYLQGLGLPAAAQQAPAVAASSASPGSAP
jgi:cytochrome c oxidase cbb3-type subunit 2